MKSIVRFNLFFLIICLMGINLYAISEEEDIEKHINKVIKGKLTLSKIGYNSQEKKWLIEGSSSSITTIFDCIPLLEQSDNFEEVIILRANSLDDGGADFLIGLKVEKPKKNILGGDGGIRGRVIALGEPVKDAEIRLILNKDYYTDYVYTGQDGTFTIYIAPGIYVYSGYEIKLDKSSFKEFSSFSEKYEYSTSKLTVKNGKTTRIEKDIEIGETEDMIAAGICSKMPPMGFFYTHISQWIMWSIWLVGYLLTIWICVVGKKRNPNKGWNLLIIAEMVYIIIHLPSIYFKLYAYKSSFVPIRNMPIYFFGICYGLIVPITTVIALIGLYKIATVKSDYAKVKKYRL